MDLIENIKSLFVLSNDELNQNLNNLFLDSFFDNSILKLKEKIDNSNDADGRDLLEKQIVDLMKLNEQFRIYVGKRMTRKTNLLLSDLFNNVILEIDEGNSLKNEIEEIDEIIKKEEIKLNDNYDIFWYGMNFRDFIESKIDFIWMFESISETENINNFFHFFTIEYMNYINKDDKLKLLHNNLKNISWLIINEDKLDDLLLSTVKNLLKKWIILDSNIKFEIITWIWSNKKKVQRSLSNINNCIIDSKIDWVNCITNIKKDVPNISNKTKETDLSNIDINNKEIRDLKYIFSQSRRIKNNKNNKFNKKDFIGKTSKQQNEYDKQNYRSYLNNTIEARKNAVLKAKELIKNWIITKEYLFKNNYILYLELYPLSDDIKKVWLLLINYYLDNVLVRRNKQDWWNKKIDAEFIADKKDDIILNLKALCLLFVEIESDNWNPNSWNLNWSSAKWLYQFLTKDWMYTTEYFDKKKWVYKIKSWHQKWEKIWKKRLARNTSSYETALNKIPILIYWLKKSDNNNIFVIQILEKLFFKATGFKSVSRINKKLPDSFLPTKLSSEEQTILFLVNSFESWKVVNNNEIKDYMWLVILWNIWWNEKLYEIFHHTAPDKSTINLMKRSVALHKNNFKNI